LGEELVPVFLLEHPLVREDGIMVGLLEEIFMPAGKGFFEGGLHEKFRKQTGAQDAEGERQEPTPAELTITHKYASMGAC